MAKFSTLGYQKDDVITSNMLLDVFEGMNLKEDYIKLIESSLPSKCAVDKFISLIETGGANNPTKVFTPMKKVDYENMNAVIKKLAPKENKRFPKLTRQEATKEGQ